MFFSKTLVLIIFLAPTYLLTDIDEIGCDCEYEEWRDGCVITQAARPGRACKCLSIVKMCLGKEVECLNTTSPSCQSGSDTSLLACQQGGGNCLGYGTDIEIFELMGCYCTIKYNGYNTTGKGGCIIIKPARPGRACKCYNYMGLACLGKEVKCIDPTSPYCLFGNDTYLSCLQGGGNCDGYPRS